MLFFCKCTLVSFAFLQVNAVCNPALAPVHSCKTASNSNAALQCCMLFVPALLQSGLLPARLKWRERLLETFLNHAAADDVLLMMKMMSMSQCLYHYAHQ
jgi:hypothetical protein